MLVAQEEVPAKGHTEVVDPAEEATCTEPGKTEGKHCSVCGEVLVAQKEIPALGHEAGDPVDEAITEATCTEAGSHDQVVYCSRCSEELSRIKITDPAIGHDWNVDETTDKDGWRAWMTGGKIHEERTCSRCGTTEERVYDIDHTTHTPLSNVPEQAETCTADGVKAHYVCQVCGHLFVDGAGGQLKEVLLSELTIPATGHTPMDAVRENEIQPTCTKAGSYDEVVRCKVCGEVVSSKYVTVDPLGHKWGQPSYKWSDDNRTVTAERICETCGAVETETATTTSKVTKEPTWGKRGEERLTAVFENPAFKKQTKTVPIPAKWEEWGEFIYELIFGEGVKWDPQSGTGCLFIFERTVRDDVTYDAFIEARVDGRKITRGKDYTAEKGSLKITLSQEYLETLSPGEHILMAVFEDGSADATFYVEGTSKGPSTGDTDMPLIWICLALFALAVLSMAGIKKLKEKR